MSSDRRRVITALAALALYSKISAGQELRIKRIGYHGSGTSQSMPGSLEAFRQGMAVAGWLEGRDYFIDARYADNRPDAVDKVAAELIAAKPDVLLAPGDSSTRALARKTKTIPIVFAIASDPVGAGHASSLQRPGGNITGVMSLSPDLAAKRLQLLRDVHPRVGHVGILFNPAEAQSGVQMRAYDEAATRIRMRISRLEIRQTKDIDLAVQQGASLGVDAFAVTQGPLVNSNRPTISEALMRSKRPAVSPFTEDVDAGLLMAYAPDIRDNFRVAASYVAKILKGARAADLAIEQPKKFELAINLKTAKLLGLAIPQSVLLRADRLVE